MPTTLTKYTIYSPSGLNDLSIGVEVVDTATKFAINLVNLDTGERSAETQSYPTYLKTGMGTVILLPESASGMLGEDVRPMIPYLVGASGFKDVNQG